MDYPIRRELTGICFNVVRDGEQLSLDLSDMTQTEIREVLQSHLPDLSETELRLNHFLVRLIISLCNVIQKQADESEIPPKPTRGEIYNDPTPEQIEEDIELYRKIQILRKRKIRTVEQQRQLEKLSGIYYGRNYFVRVYTNTEESF